MAAVITELRDYIGQCRLPARGWEFREARGILDEHYST